MWIGYIWQASVHRLTGMKLRKFVLQYVNAIPTFRPSLLSPSSVRVARKDCGSRNEHLAVTVTPEAAHCLGAMEV